MHLNLSADEVLKTTRSVRKRLDFDKPVERAIVEECLEIALQAPTGSNSQGWHWVVVEDAAKKKALADIYRKNWNIYANMPGREFEAGDTRGERMDLVRDSAGYLADNFERSPLLMIPCIEGRLDNLPVFASAGAWGSLLPAVWSFMLALRERSRWDLRGQPFTSLARAKKKQLMCWEFLLRKSHKVDSSPSPTPLAQISSPPSVNH
jgi:nitroreductase